MLYFKDSCRWFKVKTQTSSRDSCKHLIAEGSLRPTALHGGMGFGRTRACLDT